MAIKTLHSVKKKTNTHKTIKQTTHTYVLQFAWSPFLPSVEYCQKSHSPENHKCVKFTKQFLQYVEILLTIKQLDKHI